MLQISYEELYDLYITQNLSKNEIFKLKGRKAVRLIKEYNIEKSKELKTKCRIRTNLQKYGVENVSQLANIKNKVKQTCLNKYGVDNASKCTEVKQKIQVTNLEKYNSTNPMKNEDIKQKFKQNLISKYGVDNASKIPESIKKRSQTLINKYGTDNLQNIESIVVKRQQTNEKRYGSKYLFGSNYFKHKCKQTFLKRYGVDNPMKFFKIVDKIKLKSVISSTKMSNTKRLRGTFNTSKVEDKLAQLLTQKFNIVRNFRSELYPFNCDFYIPNLDLYIEYHGHWTHGTEPFDKIKHKEILQQWILKSKYSKYYERAIKTWTDLDVRKSNIAKANNLNCLVFYNEKQFMKWYNAQ